MQITAKVLFFKTIDFIMPILRLCSTNLSTDFAVVKPDTCSPYW